MRGTKFFDSELTSSFANQRIFKKHQARLQHIKSQQRNPIKTENSYQSFRKLSQQEFKVKDPLNISIDEMQQRIDHITSASNFACDTTPQPDPTRSISFLLKQGRNRDHKLSQSVNMNKMQRKINAKNKNIYETQHIQLLNYSRKSSQEYINSQRYTSQNSKASIKTGTAMITDPFTQNQVSQTKLIRANEMREIEKLNYVKVENSKILKKLENISRGKELSVGNHQVNSILQKNKTLNFDKFKKQAIMIDGQNTKILDKIMKAKPTVPGHNEGQLQKYYLERISKSQRPDYFAQHRRKFHSKQSSSVLPAIYSQIENNNQNECTGLDRIPSYRKYLHKVDSLVGPIQNNPTYQISNLENSIKYKILQKYDFNNEPKRFKEKQQNEENSLNQEISTEQLLQNQS